MIEIIKIINNDESKRLENCKCGCIFSYQKEDITKVEKFYEYTCPNCGMIYSYLETNPFDRENKFCF